MKTPKLKDAECTYFLCPDSKCKLFTKPNCFVPCESECPKKAKKAVVCFSCKKAILLPNNHCSWRRVDCKCGASNFQRMSSRYRRYNLVRRTRSTCRRHTPQLPTCSSVPSHTNSSSG